MAAGVDALKENGGRVIHLTCSNCSQGYGALRVEEKDSKKDKNLISRINNPQLSILAENCNKNRTVVDLFILDSLQLDLANISLVSNLTGGHVNYYESNNNVNDLKIKFEKIHYDLSRIISRPNYYDVKFMLRFSVGIDSGDIVGPFGKKLGEGFSLASCDPDYSFAYNLRITESLQNNSKVNFQFVCLYIDNFNERYLRIFNYTIIATNDTSIIYTNVDVAALVKCSIIKDIVTNYSIDSNIIRENIVNRITSMLTYYRMNVNF
jgi:protein transport protein SEC24